MAKLDNFTFFIICCLVSATFAIFWIAHGLLFRSKSSTSLFIGVFNLFLALGMGAYTYRSHGNLLVGYYVSDLILYLGVAAAQIGLLKFFKRDTSKAIIVAALFMGAQISVRILDQGYLAALALASYMAFAVLHVAVIIYKNIDIQDLKTKTFITVPIALSLTLLMGRVFGILLKPSVHSSDLTQPGLFNTFAILGFFIAIICLNSTFLGVTLSVLLIKIQKLVYFDSLTELHNRRFFQDLFSKTSPFNKSAYSLLILDIDFFKKINDTHGHDAGDSFLKEFSALLTRTLKPLKASFSIELARLGGEEFGIAINTAKIEDISAVSDLLHTAVAQNDWTTSLGYKPTISIGVASSKSSTYAEVFKRADVALYKSKNSGRNKTTICEEF